MTLRPCVSASLRYSPNKTSTSLLLKKMRLVKKKKQKTWHNSDYFCTFATTITIVNNIDLQRCRLLSTKPHESMASISKTARRS